jgi:ribosomal protein S18 acetylase RimI-like enzyme
MSLEIRDMAETEADGVAAMVQGLADHVGLPITTGLTGERLKAARDLIDVTVAAEDGRLLGACLALMTYSTWRGERGLYIVDLFVEPAARNRAVGLKLLHRAAAKGLDRGARFIKLEVDITNEGAARFYGRLGFHRKDADRLFFLEQDALQTFITGEERP